MPRSRDTFPSLIALVGRQWRRAVDRRLQPLGLTEATWLPLIHLARAPEPPRQKDVAASLVLDGSSVVRLLDALAAAGLVERREESGDRRAKVLTLTGHGQAIADQAEAVSRDVRKAALAGVSEKDILIATQVLTQIRRNLETVLDKEP
jgi:MarR family transcriptional regulator, transcriptional regulator for hemolysin